MNSSIALLSNYFGFYPPEEPVSIATQFGRYIPPSIHDERRQHVNQFQEHVRASVQSGSVFLVPEEILSSVGRTDGQCWLLDQSRSISTEIDVYTAIIFLKHYGDAHTFKLYGANWPGLTAFALMNATVSNESNGELLDALAESVILKADQLNFEIEAKADLASTCAGALCQLLLLAHVTEQISAGHPIFEKLQKLHIPRIWRGSLSEASAQCLEQFKEQDSFRGQVARLIQLF